jgi:hypothetical protein
MFVNEFYLFLDVVVGRVEFVLLLVQEIIMEAINQFFSLVPFVIVFIWFFKSL